MTDYRGPATDEQASTQARQRLGQMLADLDALGVPVEGDLGSAVPLKHDRPPGVCELGELLRELQRITILHDDVRVGVRAAEQLVAHVAADDPRLQPELP